MVNMAQRRHPNNLLREDEIEFLNLNYPEWEHIIQDKSRWLLIHNFPIPEGYTITKTTAAIYIPDHYPQSSLDMVYFYPHIIRKDGKTINCTDHYMIIEGKSFQRWSRHYNYWNQQAHSIATHCLEIKHWLNREFERGK